MFVVYHPSTSVTAKAVARALGLPFGKRPKATRSLIRWGSTYGAEHDPTRARVINGGIPVAMGADKLFTFQHLVIDEIKVPFYTTDRVMAEDWLNETDTRILFGRTRSGHGGRRITTYASRPWIYTEIGDHELYTGYVPNEREYRIHVAGGEVVRTQRKYMEHPEMEGNPLVRNHSSGYVFRTPARPLNSDRYHTAIAAVRALGLDFGCVDMVIDADNEAVVLEVNTGPACAPMTLNAYVDRLREMIA